MNTRLCISLSLLVVAVLLSFLKVRHEAFIGDPNAQRCGVDQPPCPFGTGCLNGQCVSTDPPRIPTCTGLPVYP